MDEKLLTHAIEFRSLMSIIWRSSAVSIDRWLQEQELGLTRLQLGVMRFLKYHPEHTLSDISRTFSIDPSTLVPTIDALERKGFVTRGRDPNDRRRVPLSLTAEGEVLLASIPQVREDDLIVIGLQHLGDEQSEMLIKLMVQMILQMPDGKQMMQDAETHLYAQGAKEQYLVCKQQETT